jgi:two-component system, cell cycle sensor histidine kinase and response regulator CckA
VPTAGDRMERGEPWPGSDLQAVHAALLDAVGDSVIFTDLEGRIRSWNRGATAIFGYSAEEMIGRTPALLYPDELSDRFGPDLERILAGEDVVGEWQGRRRDGSSVWVEIRTTAVRNPSGDPVGFLGVARDISRHKLSEEALASGKAQLALITDTAPAFIVQCDVQRRYTFVNRAYAARFGLTPDEVVGKYVWEVLGEKGYASIERHMNEVLAGQRVEFEMEIPYETIGARYIHCAYAPQLGEEGSVVGLVAVITDISEHKRAEASLRESDARLELAQAAAGLTIWEWEPQTGWTSYTPEFAALYGLPPGSPPLTYEQWRDFVHPDDRERVTDDLQAALAGERAYETEYRVVWADGSVHWISARGRMLPDVPGRPARMVGVNFDVTRRREAELQLRQLDRLETVARLAGGVAHETNNQMTVVSGAATFILRQNGLPEVVREDALHIRQAAERTAAITQQLLAFSRRQVLQARVMDLNAAVRAFEAILRRTLGEDIRFRLALSPGIGPVRLDEGQLQQVLLNLTLNARDAMPSGGTLSVETRELTLEGPATDSHGVRVRKGRYVELCLRDTGVGMDARTLAHVFEPFFTTKGVGRGTGLGLSTVYGIVKQSSGYVFAESTEGEGTNLRILLPVADDPVSPSPGRKASGARGGGESVMVVDDEPVVRAMMARALGEAGYEVLQAEEAQSALAVARGYPGPIHVLVTDLAMPGMRGRELARTLASMVPELRVLFVSGFAGDEVERLGLLEAGRPFLCKPFPPELLVARVRELLAGRPVS